MTPIERAKLSLDGLSVGDAFGERFFGPEELLVTMLIQARAEPGRIWRYTDDTEMAISIVEVLERGSTVDQDALAEVFARRFFAEDLERCVHEAHLSAEVTHAHGEGLSGAIAVAVGTALAWQRRGSTLPLGRDWLRQVRDRVPAGHVHDGIDEAIGLAADTPTERAARSLGNGSGVTAPDTVPFCLWVASWFSHDFVEAMWQTVSALGDRDTTCAIVGGIVSLQVGHAGIPDEWRAAREGLP